MKKRNSESFPFSDLAAPRRSASSVSGEILQELQGNDQMNRGNSFIDYENRAPRPRTMNRQIQILAIISSALLIIVIVLGYFTFFGGKKDSDSAASVTTALMSAGPKKNSADAVLESSYSELTPIPSQAQATTPSASISNDPNSLVNLPPSKEHPVIALTFDDGPSNTLTPKLLGILEEKGVRATFFVLGQEVLDADPVILQRMVENGDEIGNHSYDHSIYTKLTADQIRSQLQKTNDAIFASTGIYPTVMRPPTGGCNDTVLAISQEMNLATVNWSWQSCPEDWLTEHQDPSFISQHVINNAANGHIVLLHDIHSFTVDSVAAIIDGLAAKGYRFVTVSELLSAQPDGMQTGVLYYSGTYA